MTVIVYDAPVAPVHATTDRDNICDNDTGKIDLSISGGSGTTVAWYTGSCNGTGLGTGNSLQIPSSGSTSTYWVNLQTQSCNNSPCVSVTLTVIPSAVPPLVITTDLNNVCANSGDSLILNSYGGSGSLLQWSSASCGGTVFATGSSLTLTAPAVTTTYYNWWEQTGCTGTACVSITITILQPPSPASPISGIQAACAGNNATYSIISSSGINYTWTVPPGWTGFSTTNSIVLTIGNQSGIISVIPGNSCGSGTASSIYVTVNSFSVAADSIHASPSIICAGNNSSLNISGGNTGTSAKWVWYSGSCGGIYSTSGSTAIISPTITTTYYVRAEGYCNTTNCVSKSVCVNTNSIPPGFAYSTPPQICPGDSTILDFSGGNPGTSAIWKWYSGICGVNLAGTGATIVQSPVVNTVFYIRAEGYCNITVCKSLNVSIALNSMQNTFAAASDPVICPGANDTLSVTGGTLYSGSQFYWYTGGCGDTLAGTGSSLIINPSQSKTYFVRIEGLCNTTSCESLTVTIGTTTSSPVKANSDRNNYCSNAGGNITLSVSGGSGETLNWYKVSCGGTFVTSGNPKIIPAPAQTTTYWAMWQTPGCNNSFCVSVRITVMISPTMPASILSATNSLCVNSGGTITLTGSGGIGTTFGWYSGSYGGTSIGTGKNLVVSAPTITTTYWGRQQTVSCGNSTCKSIIITVSDSLPFQPGIISGITNPLPGDTFVYSVSNIQGVTYTWMAPMGWTGVSNTNLITFITGSGSGPITVIPSNGCGNGQARTLDVSTGYTISGYFTYDDSSNIAMDSVKIFLMKNGNLIDSAQADINGYYEFGNIANGFYNIKATTHKPWWGVNATDAVKVKRHFAGSELFTTALSLHAADVNLSYSINSTDAVKITRRFVGSDTSFIRGDWVFEKPLGGDTINVSTYLNDTIIVNGNNVTQNFKGLCVGDVNGSNFPIPGAKSSPKINLDSHDLMRLSSNETFELPIFATSNFNVGAISMILKYPKEMVTIDGILTPNPLERGYNYKNEGIEDEENNLIYRIKDDEIRIGWFKNEEALHLMKDEPVIIISGKTTGNFRPGDVVRFNISNDPLCEFADEKGDPIDNVVLKTFTIENSGEQIIENSESELNNDMFIFPNPAGNILNIRFGIADDGVVNISLYDILGEKEIDIVNNSYELKGTYSLETDLSGIPSGVYTCKMNLNKHIVIVKKLVVSK